MAASDDLFTKPATGFRPPHTFCCGCGRPLAVHEQPRPGLVGVCDKCAILGSVPSPTRLHRVAGQS